MRRLPMGPWMRFAVLVIKPLLLLLTRRDWRGQENVPATGGVILAANHISHADPLTLADYVIFGLHRVPRFMAKDTLFKGNGLVGRVMRGAKQIPVYRRTADASLALRDAVQALDRGECVVIYPEGTVSRDPDKWPMAAKTGVARLALLSGAPVVPVAQWGPERILDSYRDGGFRPLPPKRVQVVAGPPVDLSAYRGRELSADVLRDATTEVMKALRSMLEDLRGERAPETFFVHDPKGVRTTQDRRSA
ncbi:MAG: lysophospholipid acyltransferase family protein [Actinomycetes bacterium]